MTKLTRRDFMKFASLTTVGAAAAALAACGSEESSSTGSETSSASSNTSSGRDSITIATNKNLKDYRPWGGSNDMLFNLQVYDSLVKIDHDGNYLPKLAKSWEIADDKLSVTFHLQEGVKFQNGDDMTADDVVWSINTAIESGKVNQYTYAMGAMEKVDENTVKMDLTEAYPDVIGEFALTFFGTVEQSVVEALGTEWDITVAGAGTGPYTIDEVESGAFMKVVANENYWGGAPSIKHVTFQVITDQSTAVVSIETGDVDFCYDLSTFNYNKMVSADGIETGTKECHQLVYIPINVSDTNADSPIQDKKIRQAINYAIDREELNVIFSDGYGTVTSNCAIPGAIGYDEDTQVRHDLDKAKALMAESSCPDGCTLKFVYMSSFNTNFKSVIETIQSELGEIGITLEIEDQASSSYWDTLRAMSYGDFTLLTMECQWNDPFYFYGSLMRSRTYSSLNYSGYSNAEMDDYISYLRTLDNDEDREAGAKELMKTWYDDCPTLALMYNAPRMFAWNDDLQGIDLNDQGFYSVAEWSFK